MDKLNNTLKPVEDLVLSGFGNRFYEVFGIPILITNAPNKKEAFAALSSKQPQPKLPYSFASYTSFEVSEQRYNPSGMLRRGLHGQSNSDNTQTYNLRLLPVDTTFQVTLLAQDLSTVTKFSKAWLMSAVKGNLKFTVKYGIADIDIPVVLDRQVSIPTRTSGVSEPEEYEVLANLVIQGYLSDGLDKVQAADTFVAEGYVGAQTDLEDSSLPGRQVFKFKRPWDN